MTLNEIKDHMLKYMSEDFPDDGEYYDDDGHCGNGMWNEIKIFWKNFKTEDDFIYVVSGEYAEDIDLDGGRSYILSHSNVIPMLFDYLYNEMKYSLEKYQNIIHNSLSITDEIENLYDSVDVIRDIKINNLLDLDKDNIESNSIVIKYPSHMRSICDNCENLEFIGKSKIDDGLIYKTKINIPSEYKIVPSIKEII